jgi:hypothetical protein
VPVWLPILPAWAATGLLSPIMVGWPRAVGQRHDEERHGRETGRIVMNPEGGYTQINEPAQRVALLGSDRGRTR